MEFAINWTLFSEQDNTNNIEMRKGDSFGKLAVIWTSLMAVLSKIVDFSTCKDNTENRVKRSKEFCNILQISSKYTYHKLR